jgi:N-acetylglucosamine kinase-like BadF-type ATPase
MDKSPPDGSFLGVECGATRSVALLAPGGDAPFLRAEFGPANLRLLDDAALVEHFTAVKSLQSKAMAPLAGVAIGMAGARSELDWERIRAAAAKVWPGIPCYATSDLETAIVAGRSGNKNKAGAQVLILSGTGSSCFARNADGKTVRFGGWGHMLGDKGSGYEIGLRALKESVQFLDEEGHWPALGRTLLQSLQMNEPEDLIDWAKTAAKSEMAALAVEVFSAASKGDKMSRRILADAAESLANDAVRCARRLIKAGSPVEFILAGSVLLKQPGFARQVRAQ